MAVGRLHRLAEFGSDNREAVSEQISQTHRRKASSVFRRLVDRMPDNHEWHALLVKSLGLENDEAGLKSLYAELARAHPNAEFCARAPLDFTSGADFENALREYVTVPLRKGVPCCFGNSLVWTLRRRASRWRRCSWRWWTLCALALGGRPPERRRKKRNPRATLASALTLLAYHRDKTGDREAALACVDEQ